MKATYARPPSAESSVKPLDAGDPGLCDCFQVGLDSFPGHIVADEMEPCLWPEILARHGKVRLVLWPERGVKNGFICLDMRNLRIKAKGSQETKRYK